MKILPISSLDIIDLNTIHKVLTSNTISETQKHDFIRLNKTAIQQALDVKLSGTEFRGLMKNRPLRKFRFIKNSFTKRGDKILLSETLGIEPCEVDNYIEQVEEALTDIEKLSFLPKDQLDAIKTYVYRHGSKKGVVAFLEYELGNTKDVLKTLYRTLDYNTEGLASYYSRPIHRLSNNTLKTLYNVIDKNLHKAQDEGIISEEQKNETAKWALIRIYEIQNNQKFINAIKTYNALN